MSRRIQREDPAYLQAMREAKELFDAAIAKNSMKGRGRPAKTAVAAPSEVIDDEIDVSDVIAEAMVETGEHEIPVAPAVIAKKAGKTAVKTAKPTAPAKSASKSAAKSPARSPAKATAKSSSKSSGKPSKATTPAKPAARKSPAKKAAAPKKKR